MQGKLENPCDKCKRSKCPEICRPKQDYGRAIHKRFVRAMKEKQEMEHANRCHVQQ